MDLDKEMEKQEARKEVLDELFGIISENFSDEVEVQMMKEERELSKKTKKITMDILTKNMSQKRAKQAVSLLKQFNKLVDDFMEEEKKI